MKKIVFLCSVLMCSYTVFCQNLPKVNLENSKGTLVQLSDFSDGKHLLILSFWSTTCKPCIQEIDTFSELIEEWNRLLPVKVVAVSIDDSKSIARAKIMASGRGWNDIILLFDKNQDLMHALNVVLTPQLFIFDSNGKMIYSHTGYSVGDEESVLEILKEHSEK